MRSGQLETSKIPARYAALVLEAVTSLGADGAGLLESAGISQEVVDDPDAMLSLLDIARVTRAAIERTGEPALGYEIALGSSVTSHGLMGFGMMSSASARDAIELGIEFLQLRVPVLSAELRVDGDAASVRVIETHPLGELRTVLLDTFLVKLVRIGSSLTGGAIAFDEVELWFDYPEPDYYQRFRPRLPRMRFDMGSNEARFAAAALEVRPDTADPVNAKLIEQQCRREFDQLGLSEDIPAQVRAILEGADDEYPTLAEVAQRLNTSARTLKRRLQERGTSFHELLDSERRARAVRLLTTTTMSVEQVARRIGYSDASGFRRAFLAWTGVSPSSFRDQRRSIP